MKIFLTQTQPDSPKYGMLYNSMLQMLSTEKNFEIKNPCRDIDCIVCVGDVTPDLKSYKQQHNCPIVRFLFRSDSSKFFYTDITLVDYTFWVCDLDINILYPYLQTSAKITVPFDFSPDGLPRGEGHDFDIYVNTGEFLYANSALLKIVRTLNRLTQLRIDVCSNSENIKLITNCNITIQNSCGNIEEHVKHSKMVIGSGYAILFAIKHQKPFIILGERGYGGIPTRNNIAQLYDEFFQGAIGGRLDGALPENLVYEDIQNIQHQNYCISEDFRANIAKEVKALSQRICEQITTAVNSHVGCTDESDLSFNTDFTIIAGNGKYWLLNRFTRFIIKKLTNPEIEILTVVANGKTNYRQYAFDKDALASLVKNKVLMKG